MTNIGSPSVTIEEVQKLAEEYAVSPLGVGQKITIWWNDEVPTWAYTGVKLYDDMPAMCCPEVCLVNTPTGVQAGFAVVKLRTMDWSWSSDKLNREMTFHEKEQIGG